MQALLYGSAAGLAEGLAGGAAGMLLDGLKKQKYARGSVPKTEEGQPLSLEDFKDPNSAVWNNVAYEDTERQHEIAEQTHKEMLEAGKVVQIPAHTLEQTSAAYPDLRHMKKAERIPILRQKINELKGVVRSFLNGLKGGSFAFSVNGNILEARLYDVGIKEVMEKLNQDKASMLLHSDAVFQNAQYMYSTPDYESNPDIYRWNYFYTPVQIGDEIIGVRIAIRDMVTAQESQIYNWGIKNASGRK